MVKRNYDEPSYCVCGVAYSGEADDEHKGGCRCESAHRKQDGAADEIYSNEVPNCSQISPLNFRVCLGCLCGKEGEGTWKLELGQRCSHGGPENGCFAEPAMNSGSQRRQNACSE